MRQLVLVFGMAVVILLACVGIASAQTGHQSVFNDRDECSEALQTGNYKIYQSVYRNHRARAYGGRNFFLPKAQCVKMDVAGGVGANAKYVVQDHTISLTEKNGLFYRTDCGNRIYEIVPLPAEPVEADTKCPEGTEPGETPGVCIRVVEKEKIVTQTVTVEKPVYINPCPTDAEFDGTTSWKSRLTGGLLQAGISGGASILISKARGTDWNNSLRSGAYGVGMQRIEQAINASEDGIKLRIPSLGINQKIARGKDVDFANGVSVRWNGNRVALFRNLNGETYRCDGFGLKRGSNLAVWTDGQSSGNGRTPIKTQTTGQVPIRTGVATNNGGQIPGGGVPVNTTNGIPTRPRLGFAPSDGASASQASEYIWVTLGDGKQHLIRKN